jgi:hypothetical protein
MGRKRQLALAAVVFVVGATAGGLALAAQAGDSQLDAARSETAKYHRIDVAKSAGYGLFVDANGVACIDLPGAGAMGIHFVNGALVGDPAIDATKPEAVIYEPEKNGQMRLVALEYIVIRSAWDSAHSGPPSLFGQTFNLTLSPNRFGLPDFYSLHAWIWQHNPVDMFAPWNPEVSCAAA